MQDYELLDEEQHHSHYYSLADTPISPHEKHFLPTLKDYSMRKLLLMILGRFLSSALVTFLLSVFVVADVVTIIVCEVIVYPHNEFNHAIPRAVLCTLLAVAFLLNLVFTFTCETFQFLWNKQSESVQEVLESLKKNQPFLNFRVRSYSTVTNSWEDFEGEHNQSERVLDEEKFSTMSCQHVSDWTRPIT